MCSFKSSLERKNQDFLPVWQSLYVRHTKELFRREEMKGLSKCPYSETSPALKNSWLPACAITKLRWKLYEKYYVFSFHYNTKSWMKDLTKIQINVLQNRWGIILTICTKHYFVSECPSSLKHIFPKPSPTLLLSLEIPFFP